MRISAILAVSENNVIGAENTLPWRISNDLKWFKKNTLGKPMIMGRKTFESLPGLLPNRTSIILTRDPNYKVENAIIVHSVEEALEQARLDAKDKGADEITIVGGGEIYALFLPVIDRFYLTQVHTEIDGDTFFFSLPETEWTEIFSEFHAKSDKDEHDHRFLIFDRNT